MTQTLLDQSTARWQRTTLRRRAERRPLEIQAEVAAACSVSSLRTILAALRSRRTGVPAPHGRV
jgi:hypothetical protein